MNKTSISEVFFICVNIYKKNKKVIDNKWKWSDNIYVERQKEQIKMKITLTQEQYEKLSNLEEGEIMEVSFNGIEGWLEPNENGNIQYKGRTYLFNFYCPSEVKLSVKKEKKKTQ